MPPPPAPARRPAALLGWMDGLADETRLRLLRVLEREELSVQELCDVLRLPQSTVSRHLKTLSGRGWLASRRQGTATFYRFSDAVDAGARRLWKLARAETDGWAAAEQDEVRLEARLRARREGAEQFFAGAAQQWEALRAEAYGHALRARGAARPPARPSWTVADLGCGAGTLSAALAPHVRQGHRRRPVGRHAARGAPAARAVRQRRAAPGRAGGAAAAPTAAATPRCWCWCSPTCPRSRRCWPRRRAS